MYTCFYFVLMDAEVTEEDLFLFYVTGTELGYCITHL